MHPVGKKPAEEHPDVKKPAEVTGEGHPAHAVKKPVATGEEHLAPAILATDGEEHPSPTINAPVVKKPTVVGEDPTMKQPVEAARKKPAEEHLAGTEE
ncbi:hypothetical protein GW17_00051766 [Ensete ventricosum]|nr:hypothetical protein GW17_00051766 [Ensete ventricosum]RZR87531.1 hypothetical protein BHM03_00014954 [Ensete ventricosum]